MKRSPSADQADSAIELTRQLVRIPSENPTGSEKEVATFVARWLRDLPNVEVAWREVRSGRPNVVATLRSSTNKPPLILLAHTDTVPKGGGWSRDPFGGQLEDGRLYGRGSCDMKSGLAVAMTAFAQAARDLPALQRDLLLCATVDEENNMLGALDLIDGGIVGKESLIICTEPSDLEIVVAHKGVLWYKVEAFGRSAHAGNPHVGVDAVRAVATFVQLFHVKLEALPYDHPMLGRPTVTFSRIEGGVKTNVVPDYARLELDVRIPSPMTIPELTEVMRSAATDVEAEIAGATIAFEQIIIDRPPVDADTTGPVVAALGAATEKLSGKKRGLAGFPAYTDASIIAARTGNANAVVFGPGRLADAHTIDEYVLTAQIEEAQVVLGEAIRSLCT